MTIVRETFAVTANRIGWTSATYGTVQVACSACRRVRDVPSNCLAAAGLCETCIDGLRFGDSP
jgi:hypothetical protein